MRFSARRVMMTTLSALMAVAVLGLSAAPSSADAITDKKAQAAQIAQELAHLSAKIDLLGQQYDAAQEKMAADNRQIAAAASQLSAANHQLERARHDLAAYAVEAYVNGDGGSDLSDILLTGKGPDVVTQVAYLRAASGNRAQLVDDVRAAEYTTHTHLAALQAAKDAAHALQAKLSAEKKQADQAMADQQHLQATVTGQLAQLVQQAQARQAALAEQAAKARAAAAAPPTASPGSGPGGRGSAPNPSGSGGSTPTTQPGTPPTTSPPSTQPVIPLPIPPGTPPPVLPAAVQAIAVARKYLGTAYQWGGDSPATGFDCSGLVQYSYGQVGISLPRVADEQAAATWHVSYAAAQPGDLVFFDSPDVGHVAIYLGGGMMLDAPHTGAFVRIEPIWWASWVGFGRVV